MWLSCCVITLLIFLISIYLKQSEMDEMQNQLWTTEPEVLIVAFYKWHSLNDRMFISDPESHFCHDRLKLCPHG